MSKSLYEVETDRVALECASRVGTGNGDVRKVLQNAELFKAWLEGDTTEVAVQLKERFE